ncbi:MAG: hypothetical protein WBO36_00750 [Saprospiraceae bacterium]
MTFSSKFLLFVLLHLSVISCQEPETKDALDGSWFLVRASGGFAGIDQSFPKGDITWKFHDATLEIENKYTGQWNVSPPSSKAPYKIVTNGEGMEIFLHDTYSYSFSIKNKDTLTIWEKNIADGFGFELVK